MDKVILCPGEGQVGMRADVYVSGSCDISRSYARHLMEQGLITVGGRNVKPGDKVRAGVEITVEIPPLEEIEPLPENIPLDIVYEDNDMLVINKPKGMVVHPAAGNPDHTLVNALLYHCHDLSGINGVLRPGIVHRLDKDTSGLLVVAKNDQAHRSLAEQIAEKTCLRQYRAIVNGVIKEEEGRVDAPIGRHKIDRKKMAVVENGKHAVTEYRILERFKAYTYVECRLQTGRTHQIRVHMAHILHPCLGDEVYSKAKNPFGVHSQALHAFRLELDHPRTGERMSFTSPLPEEFETLLEKLRKIR